MPSAFKFDQSVSGKDFFGRRHDCNILSNLLIQGQHVVMYEPPKTGISTLINEAILQANASGHHFAVAQVQLHNVRYLTDLLIKLGDAVIKTVASSRIQYSEIVSSFLEGTHFVFDPEAYTDSGAILSLNWDIDQNDILAILRLPKKLSDHTGTIIITVLEEFQSIDFLDEADELFKLMGQAISESSSDGGTPAPFLMTGSRVNAMKDIFCRRHLFYKLVDRVELSPIEENELVERIVKGFNFQGKVIERELVYGVCKRFRRNVWYINQFFFICDCLSRGYISELVRDEAFRDILSLHEGRFKSMMDDLTTFQISLLKAIVDGETRFSSGDIIRKYSLNSSANVKRLKDALMKKEIVMFDEHDDPIIIDPLFDYWVRTFYFSHS